MRDQDGRTVLFSLPACWLNAMLDTVPQATEPDTVYPLDSWSMDRTGNGQDLVLMLRTPEGGAISFAMKPWHIEGMATIATYGHSGERRTERSTDVLARAQRRSAAREWRHLDPLSVLPYMPGNMIRREETAPCR